MSTLTTTYDDRALAGGAITLDRAGELLGQVMGFLAVTVGFSALGAYLGRDLEGGAGIASFVGAFACIIGLHVAAACGAYGYATRRDLSSWMNAEHRRAEWDAGSCGGWGTRTGRPLSTASRTWPGSAIVAPVRPRPRAT